MYVVKHAEKDFDLSNLEELFGDELLSGIVRVYKSRGQQLAVTTIRHHVKALFVFQNYVKSYEVSCLPESNDHLGWSLLVSKYRDYVIHKKSKRNVSYSRGQVNKYIYGLNFWLRGLASEELLPRINLKGLPHGDVVSKSLLEFELPRNVQVDQLPKEPEMSDTSILYRHIEQELGNVDRSDIPRQAALVLRKRIDAIRLEAEKQFKDSLDLRLKGLLAVRRGRANLGLFRGWMGYSKKIDRLRINPYQEQISLLGNDQFRDAILAWLWYDHDGLMLKYESPKYQRVRRQILTRNLEMSDKDFGDAIGCSIDMISSAALLLIIDFAANVNSICNIKLDSLENYQGYNAVYWDKRRSSAELHSYVHEKVTRSPGHVIRNIVRATRNYRKICLPQDRDKLFLHFHSSKTHAKHRKSATMVPCVPSSVAFNGHFKKVIEKASLGLWDGTAKAVRISVLLLEGLTGGISAVQSRAQHASTRTSQLYGNKLPLLLKHEQEMIDFKWWLQTLITIRLDKVPEKLGIDVDEYKTQKERLLGSHFGGNYCRDPYAGIQAGSNVGEVCGQFSKCMTCTNRSQFIVASESNILNALQWEQALRQAERLERISMDAIEWRYWRLFIETLRIRIREGGKFNKSILVAAQLRLEKEHNPYIGIV